MVEPIRNRGRTRQSPRRGAPSLWAKPLVRAGTYAWAVVGVVLVGWMLAVTAGRLSMLVYPLVLALFPAALLMPVSDWLVRRGTPPALASLLTIVASLALLVGGAGLLAPQVAAEAPGLVTEVEEGVGELQGILEEGILGWQPPTEPTELLELVQEQGVELARDQGVAIATGIAEGIVGLLLALVALFFYLKDGHTIATWIRSLAPRAAAGEVGGIGAAAWTTIGQYFRGQLFVALVNAVFIGLGLWILGVPLVLPLSVLVFFGGLFPIVGAFASGAVAVLVALAAEGPGVALIALAIVIGVQQLEGNVVSPIVLGRATALHPLAVIVVLTAGGMLLGVVGAFLAVPVAASVAKAVGILRSRHAPAAT